MTAVPDALLATLLSALRGDGLPAALYLPVAALAGVLLDRLFGEVKRWHPLVGFGRVAGALDRTLHRRSIARGALAWTLVVLPPVVLAAWLQSLAPLLVDALLLYFALGAQSLAEHAQAIARPLASGDLEEARRRVGWIVSRETDQLDAAGVARAGMESVLENGNDAIFGALFWFAVAGGPGALLFRLANTLDAMWGYRTERYDLFGRAAAKLDDALNFIPARLTALTYALLGRTRPALACWATQAPLLDSPNAGPVMAAGAGALGVQLGGAAIYHGVEEARPVLGVGQPPVAGDLARAIALVRRSLWLWLTAFFLIGALHA